MKIHNNFDLSAYNSLQLRSEAEHYVELKSLSDVSVLLKNPDFKNLKWHILGGGSNLVLPLKISGLVIRPANLGRELVREDDAAWFVKAQAGEVWHEFVQYTLEQGYSGLENLSLIPGSVGAAPIQNIGAYGVEAKDSLLEVEAIDIATGKIKIFTNEECRFSYRDSFFKQEGAEKYIIWSVTFRLLKNEVLHLDYGDIRKEVESNSQTATARIVSEAVIKIRQNKLPDPKILGNVGSFFKNPIVSKEQRNELLQSFPSLVSYAYGENQYKLAAGWLIDQAGWRGQALGPVAMYEKQALVLINRGGASASDVWKLAEKVREDVWNKFRVSIDPEPIKW